MARRTKLAALARAPAAAWFCMRLAERDHDAKGEA
jgi:hypothetical protein